MVNIYQVTDNRWSNALTTYNAIWMDVNNGAGGAAVGASASRLLKLTNNTTEVFGVDLNGAVYGAGKAHFNGAIGASPAATIGENGSGQVIVRSAGAFGFTATANALTTPDTILARDAANTLALRNGGTAGAPVAQTFNLYNFYVGAADYERSFWRWNSNLLEVGTEVAGTGTARKMWFRSTNSGNDSIRIGETGGIWFTPGGNNAWYMLPSGGHFVAAIDNTYDIGASGATRPRNVYIAGNAVAGGNFQSGANIIAGVSGNIYWTGRTLLSSPADGALMISNQASTSNVIISVPSNTIFQHGAADTNTTTTSLTSISNASPAVITTSAAHNLSVGTPVKFTTTGSLPTGLTVGTQYYVSVVGSSTTYQVSASVGGASINTSSAGSGTHSQVVGPISQYIRMQGAITGTDLVGAPCYILGSAGTGAGGGGSIIFQVAPASGSSGTQNSYATALTIDSTKASTFSGNILTALAYSKTNVAIGSATNSGIAWSSGVPYISISGTSYYAFSASGLVASNTISLGWTSGAADAAGADTTLFRDSIYVIGQRNSTNAQNFRVYTTYTDSSNGAWAFINAAQTGGTEGGAANTLTFGSTGNGSGLGGANSMTKFKLLVDGTNRLDYNVTSNNIWTSSASLNLGTSRLCLDASTPTDTSIFSDTSWLSSGLSGRAIIFAVNGNSTAAVAYSTLGGTGYVGGFSVRSAGFYSFLSGNSGSTIDTTITRTTTGVLKIASGTSANSFCGIQFVAATYASLPTAASAGAGARFYITDGTTSTFYATVSGTGANAVCVFSDGTQYRVG